MEEFIPAIGDTTVRKQAGHAYAHCLAYAKFGGVGLLLEAIPWLGPIFKLSNAYGAAFLFESFVNNQKKVPQVGRSITLDQHWRSTRVGQGSKSSKVTCCEAMKGPVTALCGEEHGPRGQNPDKLHAS